MTKLRKLRRVLQWIEDVRSGEMIETIRYTRHYMSFRSITFQTELDWLCEMTNHILENEGGDRIICVANSMGEIIPARLKGGGQ